VPPLYRIRGRVLDGRHAGDPAAQASLREAVGLASAQGVWLHVLRAATELVRFERRRGVQSAALTPRQEI